MKLQVCESASFCKRRVLNEANMDQAKVIQVLCLSSGRELSVCVSWAMQGLCAMWHGFSRVQIEILVH